MLSSKILTIDDDRILQKALVQLLGKHGFVVETANNAQDAEHLIQKNKYDLILMDLSLPDVDGVNLCRRVRAQNRTPIIMLTARNDSIDKVIGLEVGADDYVLKPFDPVELVARVRAQIRRSIEYSVPQKSEEKISIGKLVIDLTKHEAHINGKSANLTSKEFDLLHFLARHLDEALHRDWIFEHVWGYDAEFGIKALNVYVRRLRCKIESDPSKPKYIVTVRGYGYKLSTPEISE